MESFTDGEVFFAYMEYKDVGGGRGKKRPVVVIKDENTGLFQALKITSQVDKRMNHKYGYKLKDWKDSGLYKPSIVKCNEKDIENIKPENIVRKMGDLTKRDMMGLLVKLIQVRRLEKEKKKNKGYER